MFIEFVFDFVTNAPGYAIMIAVLAIQFVHGRISRRA